MNYRVRGCFQGTNETNAYEQSFKIYNNQTILKKTLVIYGCL